MRRGILGRRLRFLIEGDGGMGDGEGWRERETHVYAFLGTHDEL